MYFVYLIECTNGSLYTGITTNVKRRFAEHKEGIGSNYTRAHKPMRIVFTEEHPDRSSASKREAQIKRLSHKEKVALTVA